MNIKGVNIETIPISMRPNFIKIPVTLIPMNDEGMSTFNEIMRYVDSNYSDYSKLIRTPSGGISVSNPRFPAYDVRFNKGCIELTAIDENGMYRVQFRTDFRQEKQTSIPGRIAFSKFKELCLKFDVDLDDYIIENGLAVKSLIPAPIVSLMRDTYAGLTFENVHHLDLNSSHLSGLAEALPEFRPVIEHIHMMRSENQEYKAILTHSFGMMQSSLVGYKWAHLSKIMLERTNRVIQKYVNILNENNRMPILINTDGIWYAGDLWTDSEEGPDLGSWKHDHKFCRFRAKSKGAYEYIENGTYHPVIRGLTNLDKIKPRDQWKWGDIFEKEATPNAYAWDEKLRRVVKVDGSEFEE